MTLAMSFSGLFFAFFKGWLFSFILLGAFPVMFIMVIMLTKAIQSGFTLNLKSYG